MRLAERVVDLSGLVLSSEQLATRTAGIHVSTLIRRLSAAMGRKKGDGTITEDELDRYAMVGRMWEAQLAAAYLCPPRYERIGEIECDGIIGSPDSLDTQDLSVQEFKVTWRSQNNVVESEWEWLTQIKAYCHMLGVTRASLYPFYVCGTWRPPVPSSLREFKVTDMLFSPVELQDNWAMLRREAETLSVPNSH